MIGLDSSALIDFFRGDPSLKKLLDSIDDELVVNRVNYLEVMFGLNFEDGSDKKEEDFYDNLFSSLFCFDLTFVASKRAGHVFSELKKKGALIEPFDCAIAGIYLSNGVTKIITKNVKHFERIKDLEVLSY